MTPPVTSIARVAPGPSALLVLALLAGACGGTCPRPVRVGDDLIAPNPSRRMVAIAAVGEARDRSRVPALIEMLDDPDPAVRLSAYETLVELTGHRTGYRPWADAAARREAVETWRAWWAAEAGPPTAAPVGWVDGPPAGAGAGGDS